MLITISQNICPPKLKSWSADVMTIASRFWMELALMGDDNKNLCWSAITDSGATGRYLNVCGVGILNKHRLLGYGQDSENDLPWEISIQLNFLWPLLRERVKSQNFAH